jgi:hypothetical protein
MNETRVTTQAELDAIPDDYEGLIIITGCVDLRRTWNNAQATLTGNARAALYGNAQGDAHWQRAGGGMESCSAPALRRLRGSA